MKSPSGSGVGGTVKPIDGVIVGQHVVAGEEQPGGLVGEDVVAGRVPGSVYGVEGPRADGDLRGRRRARCRGTSRSTCPGPRASPAAQMLGDLVGAGGAEHVEERVLVEVRVVEQVERGLLAEAERDVRAVLVAEHRGEGEVVAVDVGDQEALDVAEAVADVAQAALEQVAGDLDRPAAVDQGEPVVGLDDVDVDGLEAVQRQRQRDPVDALGRPSRRPPCSSARRSRARRRRRSGCWRSSRSDPTVRRRGTRGRGWAAGCRRRSRSACR